MRTREAVTFALVLSGRYDTAETYVAKGVNQFGEAEEETFNKVDQERLHRDVDAILAGEKPAL